MPPDRGDEGDRRDAPAADGRGSGSRLARAARVLGARRYRQARRRAEKIRDRATDPVAPAFRRAVPGLHISELFTYPRKRIPTTYLLWLVAGYMGAHRFYLDREGTAVAQLLTGGGLLVWWAVDAFRLPSMVRAYNRDQARREAAGRPPRALDFLETPEREEGRADETAKGFEQGDAAAAAAAPEVALAGLAAGAVAGIAAS